LSFSLPNNLFTAHRLIEDAELTFRLSGSYRAQLLRGNDAPLPTLLPGENEPILRSVQALSSYMTGVLGHFIRLDDTPALVERVIDHVRRLVARNPDGCIAAILLSVYSHYTPRHAVNCAMLAARMASALRMPEAEAQALIGAALTMNLGSVDVQNQLSSRDGPPSTLQRQILDIHPLISSAMLREVSMDAPLLHTIVVMHHERKDGRGYTFGAADPNIPPLAHLAHLLDVATAKLMPRAYRSGVPSKMALASLYAGKSESFDTQYIAQLVKILGIYPPGSFVELESGDRALVVGSGETPGTPMVVRLSAPTAPIDTSTHGYGVKSAISLPIDSRRLSQLDSYWR